jgi:hypothetical protein
MNTPIFRAKAADLAKGVIVAALSAVFAALAQAMNVPGFDFATFNWEQLGTIAITAGMAYIAKNYLSDERGAFLGRVG